MTSPQRIGPWVFFLLLLALSLPFWWIGAAGGRLPVATFLPVSALMAFVPMLAALALVFLESGPKGARSLLGGLIEFRWPKHVLWAVAALLLMPLVFTLQYGVLSLAGTRLPEPQFFSVVEVCAFVLMFLIGAAGEELGWQGYAFGRLRERMSPLAAALVLGVVWTIWHIIPFIELGRSGNWIVWHSLAMIAMRIIIVWLFVNTGQSVVIAVLFHTGSNLPYAFLPNYGSYYDPFVTCLILAMVVAIIAAWSGAKRFSLVAAAPSWKRPASFGHPPRAP